MHGRFRTILLSAVISVLPVASLQAGSTAYMGTGDGSFGTVDLQTGAFTLLGNTGLTLFGLGVADGTLYGTAFDDPGTLFRVDPASGLLSTVGTAPNLNYFDFGSTTTGLYGIDFDTAGLYSIDPGTGAATLVGPTGLDFGDWSNLSTNSSSLYFANGGDLYTLSTTTGAATLIGNMGGPHMGALVFENGTLYGGQNPSGGNGDQLTSEGPGGINIDTINVLTGAATIGPSVIGTVSPFFALAPTDLSTSTPEPATGTLMVAAFAALAILRRRAR